MKLELHEKYFKNMLKSSHISKVGKSDGSIHIFDNPFSQGIILYESTVHVNPNTIGDETMYETSKASNSSYASPLAIAQMMIRTFERHEVHLTYTEEEYFQLSTAHDKVYPPYISVLITQILAKANS